MSKNETIRVLVLHESPDDAEQLINAIRNSGRATRATQIFNEEELIEQLKNHTWDLLLARPEIDGMMVDMALEHIRRLEKDIPTLVLLDQYDPDIIHDCMKAGAKDAVPSEEVDLILLVVERELNNLVERRKRRQAESNLREAEKRCQLLLHNSRDAITYVTDGMHIYANESYLEMFGYEEAEELEGMPILDMVATQDHESIKAFLKSYNSKEGEEDTINIVGVRTDGSEINCRMTFSEATYDGEPCIQIIIRNDAGDAELQEKLKEISSQDLLTGLHNRTYFLQQLDTLREKAISGEQSYAVLWIDINDFSKVKAAHSIAGGDMLLGDIASLLKDQTEEDMYLSRFSESAFSLVYPDGDPEKATAYAQTLQSAIEEHMSEIQGRTVQITVAIGISIISETAPSSQDIATRAHAAMEFVRKENEDSRGIHVYKEAKVEIEDELAVGEKLQNAIDEGLFKILFQPVISLRGDNQEFYEVFLRMMDEKGEEVSPNEFMEAAANKKLSEKIDRWVIIQSIKAIAAQHAAGHEVSLIINLTSQSLQDKTLLSWLSVAIKAARIPSDALIFQLSENDATTYLKQAISFSKGLAELHCKSSISRFGCSLNPFNTLKHLDVHYIKVDGSFTKEVDNEETRERLKEIVTTAQSQEKITIAPFVESAGVLSTLWQIGVNYIQGYYLAPPMENMDYDFSSDE